MLMMLTIVRETCPAPAHSRPRGAPKRREAQRLPDLHLGHRIGVEGRAQSFGGAHGMWFAPEPEDSSRQSSEHTDGHAFIGTARGNELA